MKVGVFGAGVIGLSTALTLKELHPDVHISVFAQDFGQNTTSDGAAGLYRPGFSFSVGSDDLTRKILRESFEFYAELLKHEPPEQTGVSETSGYIFSNISQKATRNELIEGIVPIYRNATEDEMGKWKYGSFFSSVITECRWYLPWLERQVLAKGGLIVKTKISELNDLAKDNFDVIFNCLGLGAREIFQDRTMVPLRGQVLKVVAPWVKHFYYGDHDTYIIPGMDLVTLGGTRNFDNANLSVCNHDTASIWERCSNVVPSLTKGKIDRIWVGLRPHRDPVRIQRETINVNGKTLKVIHNYGHGGYGVTSAPGSANRAVQLFEEGHLTTSKI